MYTRMMAVRERTVEEGDRSRICPPWQTNLRLFILLAGKFETGLIHSIHLKAFARER